MKKQLLILSLLFFSLPIENFSQITFDKIYPVDGKGQVVFQTADEGYLLGGNHDQKLVFVKTDKFGNLEFFKEIPSTYLPDNARVFPVFPTADGGFIATAGRLSGDFSNVLLLKFNSTGEMLWEKEYPDTISFYGSDLIETDGGDLIVVGSSTFNAVILKINKDGNLIWRKYFEPRTGFRTIDFCIEKLSDWNYLVGLKRKIIKIDADGTVIWSLELNSSIYEIKNGVDGSILIAEKRKISKFDLDGNLLQIFDFTDNINSITSFEHLEDEEFLVTDGINLKKLTSENVLLWERWLGSTIYGMSTLNDDGFMLTGEGNSAIFLMITYSGENTFVLEDLNTSYRRNSIGGSIYMSWWSVEVDYVNIEYYIEGGGWQTIAENYDASNHSISWNLPFDHFISQSPIYFRIYNPDDPGKILETETPFIPSNIDMYDFISVNEVLMWISNNGDGSHDPTTDGNGFYWPGGVDATQSAIFQDGLLYGGKVEGILSVNGNTHRQGLITGAILPNGSKDNPLNPKYIIYKIRKDWETLPESPEKEKLEYCYNNWPGDLGAPWEDTDGDGNYTPGIDKPQFIGDEVLFYVANDLDAERTAFTYGSTPLGLEFQTTVFGFDREDRLKDAVFKKYVIINKSREKIEDMYLGYWADNDMGDAGDDYIGCDTTLNLAFSYNSDNDDFIYEPVPPAVGHMILQGPVVPGKEQDSARNNFYWKKGSRNLNITSFSPGFKNYVRYPMDPAQGIYSGTLEVYNLMHGLHNYGDSLINPHTGEATTFPLSGDPVNATGWYEGEGWPDGVVPNDRRYMINTGPFEMMPGDTQEVIYAIFMAQGSDRLNSITELRKTGTAIQGFYESNFDRDFVTGIKNKKETLPTEFVLYQNYPNPFNPTTKIKYEIPNMVNVGTRNATTSIQFGHPAKLDVGTGVDLNTIHSNADVWTSDDLNKSKSNRNSEGHHMSLPQIHVKLIVYDILGRKIKTLLNENQSPGTYEIEFNAREMASGIYIYRLQAGDFVQTRKMVLLR